MLKIPKDAKGMEIAVLVIQNQNPNWNNKQIASLFKLSISRIQQIKRLLKELDRI